MPVVGIVTAFFVLGEGGGAAGCWAAGPSCAASPSSLVSLARAAARDAGP